MARQTEEGLPGSGGNSNFTGNPQPRLVISFHGCGVGEEEDDELVPLNVIVGVVGESAVAGVPSSSTM